MTLKYAIYQDEDAPNPRTEWDNMATFVCFHGRYDLGDKHDYREEDYGGWDGLRRDIEKHHCKAVILPLYLYDHSGLTISTAPFSCRWDSGQIGWAYIERERILKEFGVSRLTMAAKAKAVATIKAEVAVYDQYLTGDVWYYAIEDEDGNVVDSCGGLFGREYAEEAAKEALASLENNL